MVAVFSPSSHNSCVSSAHGLGYHSAQQPASNSSYYVFFPIIQLISSCLSSHKLRVMAGKGAQRSIQRERGRKKEKDGEREKEKKKEGEREKEMKKERE